MKLKDLYAECEYLIQGHDQLFPLRCIKDGFCSRNRNCLEKLSKRTQAVFDNFTDVSMLVLYFSYHDRPKSQRAGIFSRDLNDARHPRYITINPYAWEKIKSIGQAYYWQIPKDVLLM